MVQSIAWNDKSLRQSVGIGASGCMCIYTHARCNFLDGDRLLTCSCCTLQSSAKLVFGHAPNQTPRRARSAQKKTCGTLARMLPTQELRTLVLRYARGGAGVGLTQHSSRAPTV
eukprot:11160627-Lingulodinium_polyedra.AAC.2